MKPPISIDLNRMLGAWYNSQPARPRSKGFHPSGADKYCPVLEYYYDKSLDEICSGVPERIEAATEFRQSVLDANKSDGTGNLEYEIGQAAHTILQYRFGCIGVLWGNWSCTSCDFKVHGFMPRVRALGLGSKEVAEPAPCGNCRGRNLLNHHAWLYHEFNMDDAELSKTLGIKGHMDGELRIRHGQAYHRELLEIKTTNTAGFKGARGPLPDPKHILQASIYAVLKGFEWIHFVYVHKDKFAEWKEFTIRRDESAMELVKHKVGSLRSSLELGAPPLNTRVCRSVEDPRAKKCPAKDRCFHSDLAPL